MAYYRDLSRFRYESGLLHGGLSVGWLTWWLPYRRGRAPEGFPAALLDLCMGPKAVQHRGLHYCPFCFRWRQGSPIRLRHDGREALLGGSIVAVRHPDGTIFAAPDLICHYVEIHRYLPPAKFIEAVLDWKKGLEAVEAPAGSTPNLRGREDRPGAR
ncbi:MAG: hypothetical protein QUS11_00760 [Candidatus Fermentibacter sp.]|nr:hypothetical protein [Candidatus Fermentibacter sp.]